jgi:ribose-phosphate pyrophosphokinase
VKRTIRVFSGSAHKALAKEICDVLDVPVGRVDIRKFKNDNSFVQIQESARKMDCFVVQPSCQPVNDGLVELFMMIDALVRASAGSITVVVPYFPYGRSDKKDQPRIPITASLVARLLEAAGAHRILTMDLHAEQIQGFFRIPVDQLRALPVICRYFREKELDNPVAVAPDAGSARRTAEYAKRLAMPMAILDKRRSGNDDRAQVLNVIGDVGDRTAILFDDEVSTGGSILSAADALKKAGARRVLAAVTHPVLCGGAIERIRSSELEELIVTNTLPIPAEAAEARIKILSVGTLLAKAIARIYRGDSLNELFTESAGL